ncbi:MAG TPA: DUF1569 domain-containing protein [Cyclobacteriaceae bacterium]|mgnify:FL=1|nr:DUF1569 domain-containing protein [Cyclobacteriaceae bacterium]HQQ82505.1 DUF1569 domain-containing protein [Cyclobacteriaceae bacterium]
MKSLFETAGLQEVVDRLNRITPESPRQWGTMSVDQMLAHCNSAMDMASGIIQPKRVFIGRIIGPLFRANYSNEKPFGQSSPTSNELKVESARDFHREKEQLRVKIIQFAAAGEAGVTKHPHPFFGPLSPHEWGIGMYKHLDHHFRQFGA